MRFLLTSEEEFCVEAEKGDPQASCWIPAEPGQVIVHKRGINTDHSQEFTVKITRAEHRNIDWSADLFIDGGTSSGIICRRDQRDGSIDAQPGIDQHGVPCWRSFVFTARAPVMEPEGKAAPGAAPGCKLGQLVVTIKEGRLVAGRYINAVPPAYALPPVASSEQLAKVCLAFDELTLDSALTLACRMYPSIITEPS